MTAVLQMALPTRLPLDPASLVDLAPADRGEIYNQLDLDSWQRGCCEQAIRAIRAGIYPCRAGEAAADVESHLRGELEQRGALQRPGREHR